MKYASLYHWQKAVFLMVFAFCLASCGKAPIPKEYGYFRIDIPKEHRYYPFREKGYPYRFDVSSEAEVKPIEADDDHYWIDIRYPRYNAEVHCSYKPVSGNLRQLSDDAQELVYSHVIKASAIPEQAYSNDSARVYALLFTFDGNTATQLQFFLTDSTRHFFRGALYFRAVPNQDSIAPVADFIREDMVHLIESFRWQ